MFTDVQQINSLRRWGEVSGHLLSVVQPAETRLRLNRHGVAAAVLVSVSTDRSDGRYLRSTVVDVHVRGCDGRLEIRRVWLVARVWMSAIERDFERWSGRVDEARLAQSVERKTLNLVVVGSSPTVGDCFSLS